MALFVAASATGETMISKLALGLKPLPERARSQELRSLETQH